METKTLFVNEALNAKYVITGPDHEIEIQQPRELAFKGKLSELDEPRIQQLIKTDHTIVAAKAAPASAPGLTTPKKEEPKS